MSRYYHCHQCWAENIIEDTRCRRCGAAYEPPPETTTPTAPLDPATPRTVPVHVQAEQTTPMPVKWTDQGWVCANCGEPKDFARTDCAACGSTGRTVSTNRNLYECLECGMKNSIRDRRCVRCQASREVTRLAINWTASGFALVVGSWVLLFLALSIEGSLSGLSSPRSNSANGLVLATLATGPAGLTSLLIARGHARYPKGWPSPATETANVFGIGLGVLGAVLMGLVGVAGCACL